MAEKGGYEAAGVSIERGEKATELMRSAVEGTHGPEVLGAPGGFAGLYALAGYEDPVLASTIDGVGTKVLVAKDVGRYDTLGTDIVNHCANDVLATGARPLFFLDYVGSGRLDPQAVAGIVGGAAEACGRLGMALVGGETAEMPGLYDEGDFEIVGVCFGACERGEVVGEVEQQPVDCVEVLRDFLDHDDVAGKVGHQLGSGDHCQRHQVEGNRRVFIQRFLQIFRDGGGALRFIGGVPASILLRAFDFPQPCRAHLPLLDQCGNFLAVDF